MNKFLLLSLIVLLPSITQAQLYINEFMAKNASTITDDFNEHDDWIEIFNAGNEAIDIGGYYITDKVSNFGDYYQIPADDSEVTTVPAGGFLLIWADKDVEQGPLHTDFKLSSDGEHIGFYDDNQVLVDSLSFGGQFSDISMGRTPNGGVQLVFFQPASPLADNTAGSGTKLNSPTFDILGGFYIASISVSISANIGTVFYTTDGSDPSENSTPYTNPIPVNATTTLRAIAAKTGYLTSDPTSNTYFYNTNYTLPVLDITTDPNNLWGALGIYDNPTKKGSDWERFCQPAYFKDELLAFSVNCGIRIQGNSSVTLPKKSFRLYFKNQYGQSKLEYPLFGENNGVDKFKNIVLRSGYDDDITNDNGTLLRDPLGRVFYQQMGGLVANGNWSVLTLNNEFWGVYDLRESVNEHFIGDHIGTDDFDMVRFKSDGPVLKNGSMDDWNELVEYIQTHDLEDAGAYSFVSKKMDVDNLIDLMSFIQFTDYRSWGYGVSTYKSKEEGGKWKWTIWDMDRSFRSQYTNMMEFWEDNDSGILWANFLPNAFLKNPTFRNKFANRQADLLNTIFKEGVASVILNEQKNIIAPEMEKEMEKWNPIQSVNWWSYNVDEIEELLDYRPNKIRMDMVDFYELEDDKILNLNVVGQGAIRLNSIDISSFPWSGYYFEGIPVSLSAIAAPGYKFVSWNNGFPNTPTITVDVAEFDQMVATFEPSNVCDSIVVTEVMFNTSDVNTGEDWIEIYNTAEELIHLDHWTLRDDKQSHQFVFPPNLVIQPKSYMVIARDKSTFSDFYSDVDNVIGSFGNGENGFGFSNNGDEIVLHTSGGCQVDFIDFKNVNDWPTNANGNGSSLLIIDPLLDNVDPANWQSSGILNGMPGRKNELVLDLGADLDLNCGENEIVLDASVLGCTACDYLWDNGETTASQTINITENRDVSVSVTSGTASVEDVVRITLDSIVASIDLLTNVSCFGLENGSIELAMVGGTVPYDFEWSDDSDAPMLSNVKAGAYTLTITDEGDCRTYFAAVILEPAVTEIIPVTHINNTCFGESNGAVQLNVSGGVAPYTYLWNNGSTDKLNEDLEAGDYNLTLTDDNGCLSYFDTEITEPLALNPSVVSMTPVSCNGNEGALSIEVTGGLSPYQFLWSNDSITPSISGLSGGTYDLIITDDNNCTVTFFTQVMALEQVDIQLLDQTNNTCFEDANGAVNIQTSGGVGPYQYDWSNGDTTANIANLTVNEYFLTITDGNNCESYYQTEITAPPKLAATFLEVTNINCEGLPGAILINTEGGLKPYSFLWNNGDTTDAITNLEVGNYILTITDSNECKTSIATDINGDKAGDINLLALKNNTCFGDSTGQLAVEMNGGLAPFVFDWSNGASTENLMLLPAGDFQLTVTDANDCLSFFEVTVEQPLAPALTIDSIKSLNCHGLGNGYIAVSVEGETAPYNYFWSTGDTTDFVTDLIGGEYTLAVTDSFLCTAVFKFNIEEPEQLAVEVVHITNNKCAGDASGVIEIAVEGGTKPYTYEWSTGFDGFVIVGGETGVYSVLVVDKFECAVLYNNIKIEEPIVLKAIAVVEQPNNGNDGVIQIQPTGGVGPYQIEWNTGESTLELTGLTTGTYSYELSDFNDCVFLDTVVLSVTNLNEIDGLSDLSINPNPNSGQFEIKWTGTNVQIGKFSLFNPLGVLVWEKEHSFATGSVFIDLNNEIGTSAWFLLKVATKEGYLLKKIFVLP